MTDILVGIACGGASFMFGWSVCYFSLFRPTKKADDHTIAVLKEHNQHLSDLLNATSMSGTWKY